MFLTRPSRRTYHVGYFHLRDTSVAWDAPRELGFPVGSPNWSHGMSRISRPISHVIERFPIGRLMRKKNHEISYWTHWSYGKYPTGYYAPMEIFFSCRTLYGKPYMGHPVMYATPSAQPTSHSGNSPFPGLRVGTTERYYVQLQY